MDKLSALIVSENVDRRRRVENAIQARVSLPTTVFYAGDGVEAQSKIRNAPPQILVTDFDIAKIRCTQLVDWILADPSLRSTAVIILDPPMTELYLDELASGRVQFITNMDDEHEVSQVLTRALNFVSHGETATYYLRFLASGDLLLKEGDKADFVYIVKKGQLKAYKADAAGKEIKVLGEIGQGEFVGEMAYINGEPRNASVNAITDCELVEIPLGTLDKLLYQRPAWARTLLLTLSKRLKHANDKRS